MKRDMELVRKILLAIEKEGEAAEVDGYEEEIIQSHVGLLRQAGLVNAIDASSFDGEAYIVRGLTWEGHDFIESARNETVWRKAMQIVVEKGGGLTLEVMKQLLKKVLSQHVLGSPGGEI